MSSSDSGSWTPEPPRKRKKGRPEFARKGQKTPGRPPGHTKSKFISSEATTRDKASRKRKPESYIYPPRPDPTFTMRQYHHTTTSAPIQPDQINVDSEIEPDPEWLRTKIVTMIDEYIDVNEGEKEIMKMWNLHVVKYNYAGNCFMPLACDKFVEFHGKEIIQKNLYRNFILHLTNLFEYGVLSQKELHKTVLSLQVYMKENDTARSS